MITKHFSDESLLAWLDGEQNPLSAALTRRHLNSCWECRSRMARLEAAAHRLAEAQSRSRFLPPERVEAARQRFLRTAGLRPVSTRPAAWRRVPVWSAAGALCLAAAAAIWETWTPPRQEAPRPGSGARIGSTPPPAVGPGLPAAPRVQAPVHTSPLAGRVSDGGRDSGAGDEAVVWSVMHELGLCRERGVQLSAGDGRLRLSGVVSSAGLRRRLSDRLAETGLDVRMEVVSVDEIPPSEQPPSFTERVARVDAPGEALLVEWFSRQGVAAREAAAQAGEIANASVMAAELAWSEAWALRELAARFGPRWREMPETARILVLSMARDHWSELQTLAARQRRLIGGILPAGSMQGRDLFSAAEEWTDAVQQLFAPTRPVQAEPGHLTGRIASALAEIESLAGDNAALAAVLQSETLQVARRR